MVFCNMDVVDYIDSRGCHNPYFNRWFSAIKTTRAEKKQLYKSQSLIDGFLQ